VREARGIWPGRPDPVYSLPAMQISARNQLTGTVTSVTLGTVMAEVAVDVAGQEIVSAITRTSAEQLGLAVGQEVTVVIKATEVMLAR
jgi:molybdopterin-binding protein